MVEKGVIGLILVVCGVQFSVLANTIAKLLAAVPILQLMQGRFLLQWFASMSLCLVLKFQHYPIHILGPPGQRLLIYTRSLAYVGALGSLWCALRDMPVGEATAITYFNPVLCGLLAKGLLREELGWSFSIQAVANTLGVLLVVGFPVGRGSGSGSVDAESSANFLHGLAYALLACVCFALGYCMIRFLVGVHPVEVQVCSDSITALVVLPAALLLQSSTLGIHWDLKAWTGQNLALLVCFTASGLAASVCIILGYQYAPASKAAPFMYVEVASAFAVQVLIFGEVPGARQLLGAGIIVSAALLRIAFEVWRSCACMDMEGEEEDVLGLNNFDSFERGLTQASWSSFARQMSKQPEAWSRQETYESAAFLPSPLSPVFFSSEDPAHPEEASFFVLEDSLGNSLAESEKPREV